MNYCDIVKQSPSGGEKRMWSGVKRVSDFLEKQREKDPDEVRKFLKSEYISMNGKHLNQHVAMQLVSGMYHTEGLDTIKGELVRPEAAQEVLKGTGKGEEWYWDAYVAANAKMHDLANAGLNDGQIMNVTKYDFFMDEDFSDENKVFWYFEWQLF